MNLKIALIQVVAATLDPSKDLVAGVGKGTFAVLFFVVLAIALCFFRDASSNPTCYSICICLLPVIVFLFIWAMPKKDFSVDDGSDAAATDTDIYLFRTIGFLVFVSLCCIFSLGVMISNGLNSVHGRRMDSDVGMRDEDETELKKVRIVE